MKLLEEPSILSTSVSFFEFHFNLIASFFPLHWVTEGLDVLFLLSEWNIHSVPSGHEVVIVYSLRYHTK